MSATGTTGLSEPAHKVSDDFRPLRCLIFRGSIPHPMQSLCTLRDHCHQGSRNTRYQADATPYLGRTSTGWVAPALPGALIPSLRPAEPAPRSPLLDVLTCDWGDTLEQKSN